MVQTQYAVTFHVDEHPNEENEIVWVEHDESDTLFDQHSRAVERAAERSPYTYEETVRIKELQELS